MRSLTPRVNCPYGTAGSCTGECQLLSGEAECVSSLISDEVAKGLFINIVDVQRSGFIRPALITSEG